jgi:hypothetical protein
VHGRGVGYKVKENEAWMGLDGMWCTGCEGWEEDEWQGGGVDRRSGLLGCGVLRKRTRDV